MAPPGGDHGRKQHVVGRILDREAESKGLGRAYGEVGIVLRRNPDRVVGPAVSLIGRDQWPPKVTPEDFLETIPKLVVEIRSKNDTMPEIESKVAEYLAAGVIEVWVLDPENKSIAKHRADGVTLLDETEVLESELLPRFNVSVAQFFAD